MTSFALTKENVLQEIQKRVAEERLMADTKKVILAGEVLPATMTRDNLFDTLDEIADYDTRRQRELPPTLDYILAHREAIHPILDPDIETALEVYTQDIYARFLSVQSYEDQERSAQHAAVMKLLPANLVVPTPKTSKTYQSVVVDLSDQRIYAFEEGILIGTSSITSGRSGFGTVVGDFEVRAKQRNRTLDSPFKDRVIKYHLHVDYWIQFYRGFGIHDACNSKSCWRKTFG